MKKIIPEASVVDAGTQAMVPEFWRWLPVSGGTPPMVIEAPLEDNRNTDSGCNYNMFTWTPGAKVKPNKITIVDHIQQTMIYLTHTDLNWLLIYLNINTSKKVYVHRNVLKIIYRHYVKKNKDENTYKKFIIERMKHVN